MDRMRKVSPNFETSVYASRRFSFSVRQHKFLSRSIMTKSQTCYTVIIKPIPRGITKEDLIADHLLLFGQIKNVRFGGGRGVAGDIMYVDYFEPDSAKRAVEALNGKKDPGMSRLRLIVSLSTSSADAILKLEDNPNKRLRHEIDYVAKPRTPIALPLRPEGAFKFLKSKTTGKEICVLDFNVIDT